MDDKTPLDIDWAAIVDILASEYGWTIDYIRSLDLGQIISLVKAIKARYNKQNGAIQGDMPNEEADSDGQEMPLSDFETKLGGKRKVREDGTTEIIL